MPDKPLVELFHEVPPRPEPKVNKQLYENNAEAQCLVEELLDLPERFQGEVQTPNLVIRHEKTQHRLVLLLKLKGYTNREIAQEMEMSEGWVSQIVRQPWFQERMCNALADAQEDIFENLVKKEARNSYATMVQLRDNAKSEDVRARMAVALVERHFGKPVVRTENQTNVFHVTSKLEDINRQLLEVEEAEKKLLTRGTTVGPTDPEPDTPNVG